MEKVKELLKKEEEVLVKLRSEGTQIMETSKKMQDRFVELQRLEQQSLGKIEAYNSMLELEK